MQSNVEPVAIERFDLSTTIDLLQERLTEAPDHVAFVVDGKEITLRTFFQQFTAIANALRHQGLRVGDCVAILGSTTYEWALAEWATWRAGGVVIPIYDTAPEMRINAIIAETGAQILFVDAANSDRARDFENLEHVTTVVLEDILSFGIDPTTEELKGLDDIDLDRDATASIVFTSGTSGEPRGTIIAHRNFVDLVLNVHFAWRSVLNEDGRTIIFLPLAHVLARGLQMICMRAGMQISYMPNAKTLIEDLAKIQPTFLVVVPRVLEKVVSAVRTKAVKNRMSKVWDAAEKCAIERGQYEEDRDRLGTDVVGRPAVFDRLQHRLFDVLFYSKIRHLLGGKMEFMLSGAAALDPQLSLLFRGMGLPVMEGYGLTETTAPMAGNRPGRIRSGTVGELVPGTSVKISDDGHVLVRGVGVSPGYLDSELTSQRYDDGYFDTGDLGSLDDGYLTITGRAKNVLITSGGKSVSPEAWESQVEAHPWVAHAVMVGNNRPFISALVLVDDDSDAIDGVPEIPEDANYVVISDHMVRARVAEVITEANTSVSRAESVREFRVLRIKLQEETGLVTPTLKLKREVVVERFADVINEIYARDKGRR